MSLPITDRPAGRKPDKGIAEPSNTNNYNWKPGLTEHKLPQPTAQHTCANTDHILGQKHAFINLKQ